MSLACAASRSTQLSLPLPRKRVWSTKPCGGEESRGWGSVWGGGRRTGGRGGAVGGSGAGRWGAGTWAAGDVGCVGTVGRDGCWCGANAWGWCRGQNCVGVWRGVVGTWRQGCGAWLERQAVRASCCLTVVGSTEMVCGLPGCLAVSHPESILSPRPDLSRLRGSPIPKEGGRVRADCGDRLRGTKGG
jgi:hypothetical protein